MPIHLGVCGMTADPESQLGSITDYISLDPDTTDMIRDAESKYGTVRLTQFLMRELTGHYIDRLAPNPIAHLQEYVEHDETQEMQIKLETKHVSNDLHAMLHTKDGRFPFEADHETDNVKDLSDVYDPKLPTLGIVTSTSFEGAETVALVAQQRRLQGLPSMNVILLPTYRPYDHLAGPIARRHGWKYRPRSGLFVRSDGTVKGLHGQLPVNVDVIEDSEATPERRQRYDHYHIPTLTDTKNHGLTKVHEQLKVGLAGLNVPKGMIIDSSMVDSLGYFQKSIEGFARKGRIAIKPIDGRQGMGMRALAVDDIEQVLAHIKKQIEQGGTIFLEEYIEPVPYIDPKTNREQDWNVRAFVAGGKVHGWFARVGEKLGPVNYAQGAHIISFEECLDGLRVADDQRALIKHRLLEAGEKIAGLFGNAVTGCDLTVDEDGHVYVFEVNRGIVGGFEDIVSLGSELEGKLAPAHSFIEAVLPIVEQHAKQRKRFLRFATLPFDKAALLQTTMNIINAGQPELLPVVGKAIQEAGDDPSLKYVRLSYASTLISKAEIAKHYADAATFIADQLALDPHEHYWHYNAVRMAMTIKAYDLLPAICQQAYEIYPRNPVFVRDPLRELFLSGQQEKAQNLAMNFWHQIDDEWHRERVADEVIRGLGFWPINPIMVPALRAFIGETFETWKPETIQTRINTAVNDLLATNEEAAYDLELNMYLHACSMSIFYDDYATVHQLLNRFKEVDEGQDMYGSLISQLEDAYGSKFSKTPEGRALGVRLTLDAQIYFGALQYLSESGEVDDPNTEALSQTVFLELLDLDAETCRELLEDLLDETSAIVRKAQQGDIETVQNWQDLIMDRLAVSLSPEQMHRVEAALDYIRLVAVMAKEDWDSATELIYKLEGVSIFRMDLDYYTDLIAEKTTVPIQKGA